MLAILNSLGMFIVALFKSRRRLEAENLFLRHQISIALRQRCLVIPDGTRFIGTPNDYLGMTVDVSVVSENRGNSGAHPR
jgi:hypothetical protein